MSNRVLFLFHANKVIYCREWYSKFQNLQLVLGGWWSFNLYPTICSRNCRSDPNMDSLYLIVFRNICWCRRKLQVVDVVIKDKKWIS